jgi:hypothetical protein
MEKLDAISLAAIEKSDNFDIHECHTFEVQRAMRLLAINLHLQFIEMLGLQPTAQANDRLVPIGSFFNPQCHRRYL